MRYKIIFSYDGAAFNGYQIQPSAPSVQEAVQKALSTLLRTPTEIVGAGRTDTGVNAVNYVAHFDFDRTFGDHRGPFSPADLIYKLNAILPREIVVQGLQEACEAGGDGAGEAAGAGWIGHEGEFHARYSAVRRTYQYFFHYGKRPFVEKHSCQVYRELDFEAMAKACEYLLGEKDFSCFEKTGGNNKTSICTVYEAGFVWCGGCSGAAEGSGVTVPSGAAIFTPDFYFEITANRFLRNMVRAIVGTLLEIGQGKHSPEWILELLESKDRCQSGESVPGQALFLTKIEY